MSEQIQTVTFYVREESYYVSPRPVRKFKDTIFNLLFNKPEEAKLFNALNGTDYKDASALRIMTLEAGCTLVTRTTSPSWSLTG